MSDRQAATRKWLYAEQTPPRPRLGWADVAVLLWRAKWIMALAFVALSAAAIYGATLLPTTYSANARLLAKLDDFYVYRPLVGGNASGVALGQDQIIQAELEILRSSTVFETVVRDIGIASLFPEIDRARFEAIATSPTDRAAAESEALEMAILQVDRSFSTRIAPDSPILFTSFEHEDPKLAADALNRLLAAYLDYRVDVFSDASPVGFAEQRVAFERALGDVQADIAAFRATHGVIDLPSEMESLRRRLEALQIDLAEAQSFARSQSAQLATVRGQLANTPPTMELFTEDASQEALVALEIERQDLLSRYLPDSQPVLNINRQILQLQSFLERRETGAGIVRRGPNPLYQDLEQRFAALEAETRAAEEVVRAREREVDRLGRRAADLALIEPVWEELLRRERLAEANAVDYATRETEARARAELAANVADSIRVLEPARPPVVGRSLAIPVAAAGILFGGFTALCIGLVLVFTRRGFATPASFERTLGIPVLAVVPKEN